MDAPPPLPGPGAATPPPADPPPAPDPGIPLPEVPPPPPAPPAPRKNGLAFFAVVLALFAIPGTLAQAASPVLGLAWSEAFALLLPAVVAAAGSNLEPRRALLLARRPAAAPVGLAALVGAAGFVGAGATMALTSLVLPGRWVELFDVTRLFDRPPLERAALVVAATTVAPFCEEVAFRGWLLTALRTRHRPAVAVSVSALCFALMHLDPVRFPALLGLGALYGWLAWRSGSLAPSVVAHAVNNALGVAIALAGARRGALDGDRGSAIAVVLAAATALALAGTFLRGLVAAYARVTAAPPLDDALVRRDPADPGTTFDPARIPRALRAAAVVGAILLALLAWGAAHGRR